MIFFTSFFFWNFVELFIIWFFFPYEFIFRPIYKYSFVNYFSNIYIYVYYGYILPIFFWIKLNYFLNFIFYNVIYRFYVLGFSLFVYLFVSFSNLNLDWVAFIYKVFSFYNFFVYIYYFFFDLLLFFNNKLIHFDMKVCFWVLLGVYICIYIFILIIFLIIFILICVYLDEIYALLWALRNFIWQKLIGKRKWLTVFVWIIFMFCKRTIDVFIIMDLLFWILYFMLILTVSNIEILFGKCKTIQFYFVLSIFLLFSYLIYIWAWFF